jgi:hypothetical protein
MLQLMGRLFESFDEAWADFLAREEPLENFYDTLPADGQEVEAWVIEPSPPIRAAAIGLQRRLAGVGGLELLPEHFLHVTLPVPGTELRGKGPIELEYRRVTCFHEAVAVEISAPSLKAVHPSPTFLPHLTLAITTRKTPPRQIRDAVIALREVSLGRQLAKEAIRVAFPFSRKRFLEPWTVRERMSLDSSTPPAGAPPRRSRAP